MSYFPDFVKEKLLSIIREASKSREKFVKNPMKDFTRKRKLPFESVVRIIISMGGNSIYKELLDEFDFSVDVPTSSAFVQQREKILVDTFAFIFKQFNDLSLNLKKHRGYRLLALDGSNLIFAADPECPNTFIQTNPNSKGYNSKCLTVLYDLCNKVYLDAVIQDIHEVDERQALYTMIDRSDINEKLILTADRGLEGYSTMAHIQEKGQFYVIRVKDGGGGIVCGLNLKRSDEFDVRVNKILTFKKTKEVKSKPDVYKIFGSNSTFDFIEKGVSDFYSITFRVVRVLLENGKFETLITNLPEHHFAPNDLKAIYNRRWGIETSFRKLKHTIGLSNFHARKQVFIEQEIFAKLIMYNFVEKIVSHVVSAHMRIKYEHIANFTVASFVCRRFFRDLCDSSGAMIIIAKNTIPIRPDRHFARNIQKRSAVSFIYRVA